MGSKSIKKKGSDFPRSRQGEGGNQEDYLGLLEDSSILLLYIGVYFKYYFLCPLCFK